EVLGVSFGDPWGDSCRDGYGHRCGLVGRPVQCASYRRGRYERRNDSHPSSNSAAASAAAVNQPRGSLFMRRILQLSAFALVAGVVSACKPSEVESVAKTPTSGVRFINAVPDTGGAGGLDFRFVDIVENSAAFKITFRNNPQSSGGVTASSAIQYKAAQAGSRHFRIFLDDTIQTIASTVLKD